MHGVFTESARARQVVRWKNRCACVCTCAYAIIQVYSCACTSFAAVRQEFNGCWWKVEHAGRRRRWNGEIDAHVLVQVCTIMQSYIHAFESTHMVALLGLERACHGQGWKNRCAPACADVHIYAIIHPRVHVSIHRAVSMAPLAESYLVFAVSECSTYRFEGHWSRFQRKAPICSKTCVINRVVQDRGRIADFQGSDATGPDFNEKHQFAAKPV